MADVFISYSRRDADFVRRLHGALAELGRDVWVDFEDIPLSADWWLKIRGGIDESNTFLCVVSPDSVRSDVVRREIEYAAEQNKRIVPLLHREINTAEDREHIHPTINAHNWVFFRQTDDFNVALKTLLSTIDTDLLYVEAHTRLLIRAKEWETRSRDSSLMLRGSDLTDAENWLRHAVDKQPEPTGLQTEYIHTSRRVENLRSRILFAGISVAAVITGLLILSLLLFVDSQSNLNLAQVRGTEVANQAATSDANARDASNNAATAIFQGGISQSIALAAQVQLEVASASDRAVLLGLEALENYPFTTQAERALGLAVQNSRIRRILIGHDGLLTGADWSPDGLHIVTAGRDAKIKIWDAQTGQQTSELSGHRDRVTSVNWSPDSRFILSTSYDGTARMWDFQTGQQVASLAGHAGWVLGADWSPDGRYIATAGQDTTIIIWDAQTFARVRSLVGHSNRVNTVAWSPDSRSLLSASADGSAKIWDPFDGIMLRSFGDGLSDISNVAWSSDGTRFAMSKGDRTARIWSAVTGEELFTLTGHIARVNSVAWSPSPFSSGGGDTIVTTSRDGAVKVWSVPSATSVQTDVREILSIAAHTESARTAVWSPDGTRIVTASDDGTAKIWNVAPSDAIFSLEGHTDFVTGVAWSPDGTRIASSSRNNAVKIWDGTTGQELLTLAGHILQVNNTAWSPDGSRVLTSSLDGTVKIWDIEGALTSAVEFVQPQIFIGGGDPITSAAWSPDGERIATSGTDGTATIWDAVTGQSIVKIEGHTARINSIMWQPNPGVDSFIVTSSNDRTAKVWRIPDEMSNEVISVSELTLTPATNEVISAVWSPDGRYIATGYDNLIEIFDAVTGEPLLELSGHTNTLTAVAWSPDSRHIVSSSLDGTARVFLLSSAPDGRPENGADVLTLTGHPSQMFSVAWSPIGTRIATSGDDTIIRVWQAWQTPDELIDYARECCVVRELRAEERRQFGLPPN